MKLQKILAYKYQAKDGERVHYKYNLVVPNEALGKLGWDESKELEWEISGKSLILRPLRKVAEVEPVKEVRPIARSPQVKKP